jgi:ArsR family transcriptional regulator, repressor of sdpIR and other operons
MDDSRLVRVLKALADPTRFGMVCQLAQAGELSCGELGRRFAVSQPTISHHLHLLGEAGLLAVRHEGQHHLVSVNRALVDEVAALLPARLGVAGGAGAAGRRGRRPAMRVAD